MESKFTMLDRAIAYVAPEAACRRAVARYYLKEFSAEESRLRGKSGGRSQNSSSESPRRQRKAIDKIWDARDMEERFCMVRGILDRLEQYVCGEITYQSRTGVPEVDEAYQNYFHDWCGRSDITGRHRFREQIGMAFRGMVRDGEYGFNILPRGEEIRLQAIEADRIGSPDQVKTSATNIRGIKIDGDGAVIGYEIYKCSQLGQYTFDIEARPENFIHLFKARRADQYHGDSWLSAALPHARDIHELFAFEKQAMKFASAFAGFIKGKTGSVGGTDWTTKKAGKGSPNNFAVEAGTIRKLMEGEDIIFPTSTGRPSGNLMQFVEILIREIALGLNLPYGFIYNMADLGGVTARIELMQVVRCIRRFQKILEDIVLNRVKDEVISRGIAFGHIPPHPDWNKAKWVFGATMTGDSGNYIQETILMLQNGLIPRGDVIETISGGSNLEVARTIAREIKELQEVSAEYTIPIELLVQAMPNATQLLAAINTPPSNPPQPRGMVAQQGEKSVAPLFELLDKYANGLVERESAIAAAIYAYGVTRGRAEKWFPKTAPTPKADDKSEKNDERQ